MDNGPDLDKLLRAPLPAVPDDGFSGAVAAKLAREKVRADWWEIGGVALAAALVAALIGSVHAPLEDAAFYLATSLPFAAGCAALALSLAAAQLFSDRHV